MTAERKITDLQTLISELSQEDRALANRIFDVSTTTGRLDPPEAMHAWIEKSFGSVDHVTAQRIVKVTNRITLEGTLFNGLRASRPLDTGVSLDLDREIAATEGDDPFCHPKDGTPADVFGRVEGEHATTASNVAKYDGFHGVVVFDDHNPLHLTPEKVAGYVSVGLEWGRKALEADPEARYPFLMWNCLWRAGGSIIHGHAQVTATRGSHYPKVERFRRNASAYKREHGSAYFADLHSIHASLALDIPLEGVRAFASVSPIKEKELVVIGSEPGDESLSRAVGTLLQGYVGDLGVRAFNVAFYMPPLDPTQEDWSNFPTVVYIVDRGDPSNRTSDMGAMELYAASVVASDPFRVAALLRERGSGSAVGATCS
jgi:hypothetical protein